MQGDEAAFQRMPLENLDEAAHRLAGGDTHHRTARGQGIERLENTLEQGLVVVRHGATGEERLAVGFGDAPPHLGIVAAEQHAHGGLERDADDVPDALDRGGDEADRGVLMICDPRLISKPYGRKIWQSLPPMKRTRELQVVLDFFAKR